MRPFLFREFFAAFSSLQTEQFLQPVLFHPGTDHTETSCVICTSAPDLILFRHEIKMNPGSIRTRQHTFGTKYHTVLFCVAKFLKNMFHFFSCILSRSFLSPGSKYLVGVVMMMAAAAFFPVIMVMAAAAFFPVVMVMMLMVMAAAAFLPVVMVMMLVIMAAAAFLPVIMVMMLVFMAAAAFFPMIIVMMLVIMTTAAFFIMVMMLVFMAAAAFFPVVMVMMLVFMAAAARFLVVMVMMTMEV